MPIILGTNQYTGRPLEMLLDETPTGFSYRMLPEQTEECLLRSVADADYILAGGRVRITAAVLAKAERLKMIQRSGVGLDALDLDAIRKRNIPLYVNTGVNAESAAEYTLLLILASLRRLTDIHQNTVRGIWRKQEQGVRTAELRGKTIGIIGMGSIGQALVRLLQPFGVEILYYSRSHKTEMEERYGIRYASLNELLAMADVVSLNCALNAETKGLLNAETIGLMKDGAVLVNTARGALVKTDALTEALRSGKLSFAALDVHEQEPMPGDYPLKAMEHVILTPHIAGVTEDSFRAMMHAAFRNIACFEAGRLEEIKTYRYL